MEDSSKDPPGLQGAFTDIPSIAEFLRQISIKRAALKDELRKHRDLRSKLDAAESETAELESTGWIFVDKNVQTGMQLESDQDMNPLRRSIDEARQNIKRKLAELHALKDKVASIWGIETTSQASQQHKEQDESAAPASHPCDILAIDTADLPTDESITQSAAVLDPESDDALYDLKHQEIPTLQGKKMSGSKSHIAQTLLARAYSPNTAETLFTERIKQKPLYLRPTSPTPTDNRSRRRLHRLRKKEYFLRHQKPKPLSAREKRESGIYKLPKEECKYETFKGLNRMWLEYMREVLDLGPGSGAWRAQQQQNQKGGGGGKLVSALSHGSKLVSADFHGAEIEVVKSRCSGRVGLKGIVVRDTKFTFVIVTEGDEVKSIPKEQTVFRFCVLLPDSTGAGEKKDATEDAEGDEETKKLVFELHGSQFQNRPVDRANKKFKWRNVDYL
ncbi:hypothetical protein BJX76DRAFT_362005 [Aspergillus varians]